MSAKVIQVIEVVVLRGKCIENDPLRKVTEYWTLDGKLLAEIDPCNKINIESEEK